MHCLSIFNHHTGRPEVEVEDLLGTKYYIRNPSTFALKILLSANLMGNGLLHIYFLKIYMYYKIFVHVCAG